MDKIIIKACLNGARSREQNPNVPWTPAEIIRLLAHAHDNVMAVGDDAQSIYSFRGATVRNILEFPTLFPGTKLIKLEENYRSTQPILNLSNEIIQQAKESYTKNLFTRREEGVKPVLVEAESEHYQSRFVAQKILELREQGVGIDDIAVLFRSSFHSFDLELELSRRNLPFVKQGTGWKPVLLESDGKRFVHSCA